MAKAGRKAYGDCAYERHIIKDIMELWRSRPHGVKFGYAEIASKINKKGLKTRMGKPFYGNLVRRIIERELKMSDSRSQRKKGRIKQHVESRDWLTPEEVEMCRAVLREGDRLIFEVLLGAGLRAEELCDLDVRDLGIYHGQSLIDVRCGKFKRNRSVKIAPGLRAILEIYLEHFPDSPRHCSIGRCPLFPDPEGERIRYRTIYERIVAIGKRAGLAKRLHPHMLRHTFACGLHHYKNDMEFVRQQLGHASIATTQIYVKVFENSQLEQMEGFERLYGRPQGMDII